MKLNNPKLIALMQKAYSAEKAAAFAYIGHAASLKNTIHKAAVKTIEKDEWNHRKEVLAIMLQYNVSPSRWLEVMHHFKVLTNISAFKPAGKINRHKPANYKTG